MSDTKERFKGWAILELMGHRRLGGFVSEDELAGAGMLRIDIPKSEGEGFTCSQYYSPAAMYALTLVSEEIARAVAKSNQPQPAHSWELPARQLAASARQPIPPDHDDESEFEFHNDDEHEDES